VLFNLRGDDFGVERPLCATNELRASRLK
jgi:hypothetical protein